MTDLFEDSNGLNDVRNRVYAQYRTTTAANQYKAATLNCDAHVEQYRRRWRRYLPDNLSVPMLDVGCGGGEFLLFLSQAGCTNVMGIDLSPQQIALARQRGLENTVVADAMTFLKQRTGTYALINASSILEHLTRPELFHLLDLTVAALRPGGLLFGVVPNAKSFLGSHVRYGDITHELCFTPESLVQIFQIVGLRPIALLEHGPIVHGVISAVRWSIWQCLRAMMWTAFVAEGADYQNRVYTQNIMFVAEKA